VKQILSGILAILLLTIMFASLARLQPVKADASTVVVTANPLWTDTGFSVAIGTKVEINASGLWCLSQDWRGWFGPDGLTWDYGCWDTFLYEANHGELIAFVGSDPYQGHWGDGNFFPQHTGYWAIGSSGQFTSNKSGELWLGFNDDAVTENTWDNGGSVTALIVTSPSYFVTFNESGLPSGTGWWVDLNGNNQSSASDTISFSEPNGVYTYSAGASGYLASRSSGSVPINGAGVSQTIQFQSAAPAFQLQVSPQSQTVPLTGNCSYNIEIEPYHGFSSNVTLIFTAPRGATCSFAPTNQPTAQTSQISLTQNYSSTTLYVYAFGIVQQGNYPLGAFGDPDTDLSLPQTRQYTLQLKAVPLSGDPVNQVLGLTITNATGVENIVTIDSLKVTSSSGCKLSWYNYHANFTIQQNFWVNVPSWTNARPTYWVQNVIFIGLYSDGNGYALALYNIYLGDDLSNPVGQSLTGPQSDMHLFNGGTSPYPSKPVVLNLTSVITNGQIQMITSVCSSPLENSEPIWTFSWPSISLPSIIPSDSYITFGPEPSNWTPQLDIVGPGGGGTVAFDPSTSNGGQVQSSLRLTNGKWTPSVSFPVNAATIPSQTGETSTGLIFSPGSTTDVETYTGANSGPDNRVNDQGVAFYPSFLSQQAATSILISGSWAFIDQTKVTGVYAEIVGSSAPVGTSLIIISSNQGTTYPYGSGTLQLGDPDFYDVQVSSNVSLGLDAMAVINITNPDFTSQNSVMSYWDGIGWVPVPSQFIAPDTVSGNLSVSDLTGTPIMVANSSSCVVTFDQLGVDSNCGDALLVVDNASYYADVFPVSFIWPFYSMHTFVFQSPLNATASAEQYVWTRTSGLSSMQSDAINATTYGSIIGNYSAHDLALTNVMSSKAMVVEGNELDINFTVANQGDYTETFNVTLYGGWDGYEWPIYTFTGVTLVPGGTVTLIVAGLGFGVGSYTLNVRVYNAYVGYIYTGVTVLVAPIALFRPWSWHRPIPI